MTLPNPNQSTSVDSIGVITVHDGPSLPPDEIIAPIVGSDSSSEHFHNNFQDAEAFLLAGGRRGRQYLTLTDGTYFINRWFATVEMNPKTVIPIGYVGVVVSYVGRCGDDVFRCGLPPRRTSCSWRKRGFGRKLSGRASTLSIAMQAASSLSQRLILFFTG